MRIEDLKKDMDRLNGDIKRILKSSGYAEWAELDVEYDRSNPDDVMLHDELSSMMSSLDEIACTLDYLNRPVKVEGILRKNRNGRYEIGDRELSSGSPVEALVYDRYDERWEWTSSRIEYDHGKGDYYLVSDRDVDLDGLRARIR